MLPALIRGLRSALLAAVASAGPAWAVDDPLEVREVAAGVFVHQGAIAEFEPGNRGDIANIGFVVGSRCVAVIDTGSTIAVGRGLLAALRARSTLPVCYVINTHMHLDHVFGNGAFEGPGTEFVASATMPASLSARAEDYLRTLRGALGDIAADTRVVYPGRLVEDRMRLDLGGRTLVLERWPTAHTDNDLTVFDEATATLWTGDLLFDRFLPIVDGSLRGWLSVIDELARRPARHVVPGHGRLELAWPDALQPQKVYLAGLAESVRSALRRGRTLREVLDAGAPAPAAGWQLAERFHARNLSAAYTELEWED